MTAAAACSLGDIGDIGDASVMDADAVAAALEVDVETGQWLVCAAMASVVLIYSELQKLIRRRWGR